MIYGKFGHAEVIGLTGQTNNEAIIVMEEADLDKIDFNQWWPLSQTQKYQGLHHIRSLIEERIKLKEL